MEDSSPVLLCLKLSNTSANFQKQPTRVTWFHYQQYFSVSRHSVIVVTSMVVNMGTPSPIHAM